MVEKRKWNEQIDISIFKRKIASRLSYLITSAHQAASIDFPTVSDFGLTGARKADQPNQFHFLASQTFAAPPFECQPPRSRKTLSAERRLIQVNTSPGRADFSDEESAATASSHWPLRESAALSFGQPPCRDDHRGLVHFVGPPPSLFPLLSRSGVWRRSFGVPARRKQTLGELETSPFELSASSDFATWARRRHTKPNDDN